MPAKQNTTKAAKPVAGTASQAPVSVSSEHRRHMISEAAYFRALERGFEGENAEDDWYAAEAEIRKVLREM